MSLNENGGWVKALLGIVSFINKNKMDVLR